MLGKPVGLCSSTKFCSGRCCQRQKVVEVHYNCISMISHRIEIYNIFWETLFITQSRVCSVLTHSGVIYILKKNTVILYTISKLYQAVGTLIRSPELSLQYLYVSCARSKEINHIGVGGLSARAAWLRSVFDECAWMINKNHNKYHEGYNSGESADVLWFCQWRELKVFCGVVHLHIGLTCLKANSSYEVYLFITFSFTVKGVNT